jgi:bifunctional DNA-binding transcriptional regulator/antitoxin component of YhaV-PrlF toxin-antitoxin module
MLSAKGIGGRRGTPALPSEEAVLVAAGCTVLAPGNLRFAALLIDFRISVIQFFSMGTTITISPRGTLTLPIAIRRKLRLDKNHSVLLAEERPDGIFLHPAVTVPIRDIPAATIKKWITNDEADAASARTVKK